MRNSYPESSVCLEAGSAADRSARTLVCGKDAKSRPGKGEQYLRDIATVIHQLCTALKLFCRSRNRNEQARVEHLRKHGVHDNRHSKQD